MTTNKIPVTLHISETSVTVHYENISTIYWENDDNDIVSCIRSGWELAFAYAEIDGIPLVRSQVNILLRMGQDGDLIGPEDHEAFIKAAQEYVGILAAERTA